MTDHCYTLWRDLSYLPQQADLVYWKFYVKGALLTSPPCREVLIPVVLSAEVDKLCLMATHFTRDAFVRHQGLSIYSQTSFFQLHCLEERWSMDEQIRRLTCVRVSCRHSISSMLWGGLDVFTGSFCDRHNIRSLILLCSGFCETCTETWRPRCLMLIQTSELGVCPMPSVSNMTIMFAHAQ